MNLMSLLNLIFIFDIVKKKKKKNIVSKNETSMKLKFNFLKFLTKIKISIIPHFSIKSLSLNNRFE